MALERFFNERRLRRLLENLKPDDRVALILDDDLDGYSSGVLIYDFLKKKQVNKIKVFIFYRQKLGEAELEEYNKIFVCDLGENLVRDILNLSKRKDKEVVYFDHHLSDEKAPKEVIEIRRKGFFPTVRLVYDALPKRYQNKKWLAVAGVFADSGQKYVENRMFINSFFKKNKIDAKYFVINVVHALTGFLIYNSKSREKAFFELVSINDWRKLGKLKKDSRIVDKEINKHVKEYEDKQEYINGIYFYYFEPKYSVTGIVNGRISFKDPDETFVFVAPDLENNDKLKISARSQNRKINTIKLLAYATKDFKNSSSGGHIPAAGGTIMRKDLKTFKKRLAEFMMNGKHSRIDVSKLG
jgi:single-stranded DNA-specific DHH superfamily exonuclease